MSSRFLTTVALFAAVAACSAEPVRQPPPAATPADAASSARSAPAAVFDPSQYRLGAGDSVQIDVFGEPELSLVAAVDTTGHISYPFLGLVRAAGTNVRELERRIRDGLMNGFLKSPDVRVSVARYRPIYVSGQVRQAGAYPYALGLTVGKALTLAGGVTQFASPRRIYLHREGTPPDSREQTSLDTAVFPGDTIMVEERLF